MASGVLGGLFEGIVNGYSMGRKFKTEDEDRKIALQDRQREVEWRQEDRKDKQDDRLYARQERDLDRSERSEDRKFAREDRDFKRNLLLKDQTFQDYQRGRQMELDKREDTSRDIPITAYKRAQEKASEAESDAAKLASTSGVGQGYGLFANPETQASRVAAAKQPRSHQDFLDYYQKEETPRVLSEFVANGEPEKAAAYQAWVEQSGTRKGMESYARAVQSASIGDEDGFIKHMASAYNNEDYFGDGVTLDVSRTGFKKDKAGNIVGGSLAFKDQATGKEWTQEVGSEQDLYRLGLGVMSPEQVFKYSTDQIAAGQKASEKDQEFANQRQLVQDKALAERDPAATMTKRVAARTESYLENGQLVPGPDGKPVSFGSLSPEQQSQIATQAILAEDAAIQGGAAPAARGVGVLSGAVNGISRAVAPVPVWRGP